MCRWSDSPPFIAHNSHRIPRGAIDHAMLRPTMTTERDIVEKQLWSKSRRGVESAICVCVCAFFFVVGEKLSPHHVCPELARVGQVELPQRHHTVVWMGYFNILWIGMKDSSSLHRHRRRFYGRNQVEELENTSAFIHPSQASAIATAPTPFLFYGRDANMR